MNIQFGNTVDICTVKQDFGSMFEYTFRKKVSYNVVMYKIC